MNLFRALAFGLIVATFAGCAGGRKVDGLYGRWGRSYTVNEHENRAQVTEVWQFKGDSASLRATWNGFVAPGETVEGIAGAGPYRTVVDQDWNVRYRGQSVFSLEEKGRRVDGPKFMEMEDYYELERNEHELTLDAGPSDEPLRPLSGAAASGPRGKPAAKTQPAPRKKKKS